MPALRQAGAPCNRARVSSVAGAKRRGWKPAWAVSLGMQHELQRKDRAEEEPMKRATLGLVVAFAVVVGAGALGAQGQAGGHQPQSQAAGHEKEVFCSHLSTGQLCTPGTAAILKLDGAKKDSWSTIARKYNQGVAAATKQFLQEAKGTLSPQEFATVEKWFAHDVNEQLNRQVIAAALAGNKH